MCLLQVVGVNVDSGERYTAAAARLLRSKVNLRSCFDYGIGMSLLQHSCARILEPHVRLFLRVRMRVQ